MFGIDQISWTRFWGFILFSLLSWYLCVAVWSWFQLKKSRSQKPLFEDDFSSSPVAGTTSPVSVSAKDYPAGLISLRFSEDLPLPVSLYEESGIDDGYPIDCFTRSNHPVMPKILEQVQFQ